MPQETSNDPEIATHLEPAAGARPDAEEGVDLVEVAILLMRGKRTIMRFMVVAVALTAIVVYLVMKPMYTAEAVFLPPQNAPGSGMAQLASQLGSLGAIGALGGIKNSGEVYVGILGSRTIADTLVKRFDLQKVYKTKRLSDTEKALKGRSKFVVGKDTLITISVEDHDPRRAAGIANGYLDALHDQNGRLALTDSAQRRLFFGQQLEREKNALEDAEVELKKTQEQTGLIVPAGQALAEIQASSEIRAQITSRQVELAALQQSATNQNPLVVRLQTEIAGLQQQLQKLQSGTGPRPPGSIQVPTAKVPELALEYVRKQREVKYHETLFALIARQYETARLDESRDAPLLQVVDTASIPDKKSGPPRLLLLLASCILGAFAGAGWVIGKTTLAKLRAEPASAAKLEALQQAASLGR
ncbi:MAG: Wzz/FepE/Etk N-terminal domain-containing protein [Edaphobacter sp.]